MKRAILILLAVLIVVPCVKADTVPQVEDYLLEESPVPLGTKVAKELAINIIRAQEDTPYAHWESDSFELSLDSVLRALTIDLQIALIQSTIAIDDRVSVQFSAYGYIFGPGEGLNFGTVQVGSTGHTYRVADVPVVIQSVPEPSVLWGLEWGLFAVLLFALAEKVRS